jgi:hypothetical protein
LETAQKVTPGVDELADAFSFQLVHDIAVIDADVCQFG